MGSSPGDAAHGSSGWCIEQGILSAAELITALTLCTLPGMAGVPVFKPRSLCPDNANIDLGKIDGAPTGRLFAVMASAGVMRSLGFALILMRNLRLSSPDLPANHLDGLT